VLPYLENLHFPSPPDSGAAGSSSPAEGARDTVTEHELRLRREEQARRAGQEGDTELPAKQQKMLVRKKSKTTSCIKLKNGCKQQ
jgi:hypothetical protein